MQVAVVQTARKAIMLRLLGLHYLVILRVVKALHNLQFSLKDTNLMQKDNTDLETDQEM